MTPDVPTLEDRARRAAAGVKEAVDTADLQLFAAGIPALRTPKHRHAGSAASIAGSQRLVHSPPY